MQAASLPASYGWQWVRDGLRLFAKQPLAIFFWAMFISLLVVFATVTPPVGPLLFVALMPAITVMTLAACKHIEADRVMLPSMWPKALQLPGVFRKLLVMGVAYAVVSLLAGLVSFLPFSDALTAGLRAASVENDLTPFVLAMRVPLFIFAVLYVIIAALFWHAPVLVAWHGLRLRQALFFSGIACWRNKWPFMVYGAAWILIFLFIDLCAGILVWMGIPANLANTLQIPFNIAAGGILYCSFYPAYTSVFGIDNPHAHLDHRHSAHA
ncbi:BPSS1780 family membrane protein [Bordetella genomosp. 1]|uniref:BPSS1780 family membrane protein n=1 Tax=Bordetella genomosp. 1 TaxID=1395607 RepID=UPI0020CF0DC2|nr:BPSS1780 family membrane protein [Bordetella genomosp. 1]MDQ8033126.1 BPSS1780 family membrane protein [Bordetella sp.]